MKFVTQIIPGSLETPSCLYFSIVSGVKNVPASMTQSWLSVLLLYYSGACLLPWWQRKQGLTQNFITDRTKSKMKDHFPFWKTGRQWLKWSPCYVILCYEEVQLLLFYITKTHTIYLPLTLPHFLVINVKNVNEKYLSIHVG